ncbi:MAG: ribosomal RNA small subunit methyltransferase A [Methanobacteriota archaeon]|nr:MAG: ribosomal RNA small subunit methyltransferase A [Euryarchaeota archaeon]
MNTIGLLKRYGIVPKKKLGQNFLVCIEVAEREVRYADIQKDDVVLEIGPGLGVLTRKLAERAKLVVAVEKDLRLKPVLEEVLAPYDNIQLFWEDILSFNPPPCTKIVSNLPYSISSPIIFWIMEKIPGFSRAVICCQKEFAKKLVALPGQREYSRLSVVVGTRMRAEILETLKPEVFFPPPEVDSALVRLEPKTGYQPKNPQFRLMTHILFRHKRKKVKNAVLHHLSRFGGKQPETLLNRLEKTGLGERRVYTLSPEEIDVLAAAFFDGEEEDGTDGENH